MEFITLILIICSLEAQFIAAHSSLSDLNALHREIIYQINKFSTCTISVINFKGLNLDMTALLPPITLHRYFDAFKACEVYPYELRQWVLFLRKELASSLITHWFLLGNKKSVCKADISVYPPGRSGNNLILRNQFAGQTALLTMSWPYLRRLPDIEGDWKRIEFRTKLEYSVLVYQSLDQNICNDNVGDGLYLLGSTLVTQNIINTSKSGM